MLSSGCKTSIQISNEVQLLINRNYNKIREEWQRQTIQQVDISNF